MNSINQHTTSRFHSVRTKSLIRFITSVSLAGILMFFLLRLVRPKDILDLILAAEPPLLLAAFCLYSCVYYSRSLRLKQFAALNHVGVWGLFPVAALHGFFNFILPLRTGEATLVYLLRRVHGVVLGGGLGVLIVVRVFDLSSLGICFAVGLVMRNVMLSSSGDWMLVGITVVISLVLVLITISGERLWLALRRFLLRLARVLGMESKKWCQSLFRLIDDVISIFEDAKSISLSLRLLLTSFMMWIALFATFWALLRAMGIQEYNLAEVMIGSTGAALSNALPVNAIGSIGTLEIGWTAGYSLLGMPVETGIASGFAIHLFTMVFSTLWAAIAYLLLAVFPKDKSHSEGDLQRKDGLELDQGRDG